MIKLYYFFKGLNKYLFIALCIIGAILFDFVSTKIILFFSEDKTSLTIPFPEEDSLLFIFTLVVILGPLVETLIFQFGIIELFLLINKSHLVKAIALLVSSVLFGLSHSYSLQYIIHTSIFGFLFSSCYLLAKERKDIHPFMLTFLAHSSSNLFVFLINEIF